MGLRSSPSSMVSSVGAAVGPFLLLGEISQPFYLVFTANSAQACANSRLLTGGSLAPHPWGETPDCGGMQMVNRGIPRIWGISCIEENTRKRQMMRISKGTGYRTRPGRARALWAWDPWFWCSPGVGQFDGLAAIPAATQTFHNSSVTATMA